MLQVPDNLIYHFMLFAPGLETWIFRAARRYWAHYRPVLYSMRTPDDVALISYADARQSRIALTLIMRRDTAAAVRAVVEAQLPQVFLDPLVYDSPTDLQITLNARVEFDQRFGVPAATPVAPFATAVPIVPPTPIPSAATPSGPVKPTPGPIQMSDS